MLTVCGIQVKPKSLRESVCQFIAEIDHRTTTYTNKQVVTEIVYLLCTKQTGPHCSSFTGITYGAFVSRV